MLCVLILYISGGTYSLKSTPNDRFFEKLYYMAILFTLRVFARILLRGNRRKNTFCISFWFLAWDSNTGFSSNKPTHYLLDHGDFFVSFLSHYTDIFIYRTHSQIYVKVFKSYIASLYIYCCNNYSQHFSDRNRTRYKWFSKKRERSLYLSCKRIRVFVVAFFIPFSLYYCGFINNFAFVF